MISSLSSLRLSNDHDLHSSLEQLSISSAMKSHSVPPSKSNLGRNNITSVSIASNGQETRGASARDEIVQVSMSDLEAWKRRMIAETENHFQDQQLKRIAEFGRVHGSLVVEAQQYVSQLEKQLKQQFQIEKKLLVEEAEEHIRNAQVDSETLQAQVTNMEAKIQSLELENERLRVKTDCDCDCDCSQNTPRFRREKKSVHFVPGGPENITRRSRPPLQSIVNKSDPLSTDADDNLPVPPTTSLLSI